LTDLAIEAAGLCKQYGRTLAVAGLDLAVGCGEVFGFLGPNGSGKTTAIKMLLGLVRPTAGQARVLGEPAGDWRTRARVGFLPEHFRFQDWLRASEFLDVHGRLYGMGQERRRRRAAELLEMLELSRHAERPLREFSKGMLQRIGLAQALLNIIQSLRGSGATVFLNSHLLSEIEITCDRVAFIRRGRVVESARLGDLLAQQTEVELRLDGQTPELLRELARFGPARDLGEGRLYVRLAGEEQVPDLVTWLVAQGVRVYGVTPRRTSLEDVFLRLMAGEEAG